MNIVNYWKVYTKTTRKGIDKCGIVCYAVYVVTEVRVMNKNLHKAKSAKNDEFYTQLTDIEKELWYYKDQFKDKIVFCNCDDPYDSNFFKYFALNFNFLGLRKLITTHYTGGGMLTYKLEITDVPDTNGDGAIDLSDIEHLLKHGGILTLLDGDGDFRSPECVELLKEADIVVTNPPFSLFREYVDQLIRYKKQFLIIGNANAITYKEIFGLIKENKIWLGVNTGGTMEFVTPHRYSSPQSGYRVVKIFARWFTNLDVSYRHRPLTLYAHYLPEEYPHYDNYDAINVNRVADIPKDWDGVMGVPISFLDKHNPEQFKIVRFRKGDDEKDLVIKGKSPYFRILIKRIGRIQ